MFFHFDKALDEWFASKSVFLVEVAIVGLKIILNFVHLCVNIAESTIHERSPVSGIRELCLATAVLNCCLDTMY